MNLNTSSPQQALNQAYRKDPIEAASFDAFLKALKKLLSEINEAEQEENVKNLMADFLKDAFYKDEHHINTKGDIDLAIHHKDTQKSAVGVLIETKKPNSKEMMTAENANQKALQQLVFYYLMERVEEKNTDIKQLIATDVYTWFVFDESIFDKHVYGDKKLVKQFEAFRREKKPTSYFYAEIAQPHLDRVAENLTATTFDLRDYQSALRNESLSDEDTKRLISLYKVLSPVHLLKKPFANDSNSLNTAFYTELLYILGLEEVEDDHKKVIRRKDKANRDGGSFLENAIAKLERKRLDRIEGYKNYGETEQERIEAIALELCITWTNRVLFLKLLEAQLLQYQKGDKKYQFLNSETITSFGALDELFFEVLAVKPEVRRDEVKAKFAHIPYLNSSLFEETILETDSVVIGNLLNEVQLPIYARSVLKDDIGNRSTGAETPLKYLFRFLDAYNFASEGTEEIHEDKKSLINASVLGLIFEKINGYKDGSFYTPSFITMYMCRETLRHAVVQKFSEQHGKAFKNFEHLQDFLADKFDRNDRLEANKVVNSLKICDPAVGSGHFLVSALNELIAIKADLGILANKEGKKLPVGIRIENDELFVLEGGEADFFAYKVGNKDSQNIQETLFHEKQTLIENCLFGVDINPNSVKICRLRLWIELLKNAYYLPYGYVVTGRDLSLRELQTLPNIDINIKTGNSLISRFSLDSDMAQALKRSKWNMSSYKLAVQTYRNASSKEEKREMERLIESIKGDFRSEIGKNDPKLLLFYKRNGELQKLLTQTTMFLTDAENKKRQAEQAKLEAEIAKLSTEIEEIKSSKIYQNAFEWRFEFPEVLNDNGDFIGFDVVMGNPPYIRQEEISWMKGYLEQNYETYAGTADLLVFFIELGMKVLKQQGHFTFIISNKFMRAGFGQNLRVWMQQFQLAEIIDFGDLPVFTEATTYPCILSLEKAEPKRLFKAANIMDLAFDSLESRLKEVSFESDQHKLPESGWNLADEKTQELLAKLKNIGKPLGEYVDGKIYYGIKTGYNEAFVIDEATKNRLIAEDPRSAEVIKPFLAGRDIKRYQQPKADKWLILFPKGFTIKRNLPPSNPNAIAKEPEPRYGNMPYDDAWEWLKSQYPAIAKYLLPFKAKAQARTDQGDYWWELRACDYYGEFEKEKILWPGISHDVASFAYDTENSYGNDNNQLVITQSKYLLGVLNSLVSRFVLFSTCDFVRGGFARLKMIYVKQIPIAEATPEQSAQIEFLVTQILSLKKENPQADTSGLEAEIDQLVYRLYGLTEEEIKIVEGLS